MDTYGIGGYGAMIADRVRVDAYREALGAVVTPDSVVLDLGTGTGLLALLACRLGARHVYAIESSSAIDLAREIARENGLADRIVFIHQDSTRVSLPQPADVIVSDLRGVLPLFERHLPAVIDARVRMLSPAGALIPRRDVVRASPVEVPDLYHEFTGPWDCAPSGIQMQAARRLATQAWRKARIDAGHLLATPQVWISLDYTCVVEPDVRATLLWTVERAGEAHGFVVWFDSELAQGVGFSNAPGEPEMVYGQAFFPWPEAVPVLEGDSVEVSLNANLVLEDYVWSWKTKIVRSGGGARVGSGGGSPGEVRAEFDQSTFYGQSLSLEDLHRREAGHVPVLSAAGRIARFVLVRMDGETNLSEIVDGLLATFPDEFLDRKSALDFVGRISLEHGA